MEDDPQSTCVEDLLVELYTLENTIESHFDRGTEDEEDTALEAYEAILHAASHYPPEQERESTLKAVLNTLAARFLALHFYQFPHVQLHVMEALVSLCRPEHVLAVRMQSLQSLWWILKTAVSGRDALSSLCRQRIQTGVDLVLEGRKEQEEKEEEEDKRASRVMVRVAQQVQATLDQAVKGRDNGEAEEEGSKDKQARVLSPRRSKLHAPPLSPPRASYSREERMSRSRSPTPSPSRSRRPERPERRLPSPEPMRSTRRERTSRPVNHRRSLSPSPPRPQQTLRPPTISVPLNPKNCPPGPHLFIGGVPRDAIPSDLVSFLAPVDPGLTNSSVHIKMPSPSLPAGYAFVNMTSTTHAIDAIDYVKTTPYRTGRPLICDFARGPPTPLLRFIERQNLSTASLHGHDAVHLVNFDEKPPSVWKQLCRVLDKVGRMDEVDAEERRHGGLVRFEDVECAKAVIRRHHLIIDGYEVLPVYYAKGTIAPGQVVSYTNDPKPTERRASREREGREGGGRSSRSYREETTSRSPPRSRHEHVRKESLNTRRTSTTSSSHHHHSTAHRYESQEESRVGRYGPAADDEGGRSRSARASRSPPSPREQRYRPSSRTKDDRSIAEIARDVKANRYPSAAAVTRRSPSPSPSPTRRPSAAVSGRSSGGGGYERRRPSQHTAPPPPPSSSSRDRYKKRSRSYEGGENSYQPSSQRSRIESGREGGNNSNGSHKRREKSFEENVDELMVDYDEEE